MAGEASARLGIPGTAAGETRGAPPPPRSRRAQNPGGTAVSASPAPREPVRTQNWPISRVGDRAQP